MGARSVFPLGGDGRVLGTAKVRATAAQVAASQPSEAVSGPVLDPPPMLRTSERNDFKRCPWKWEQVWVKGLRKKQPPVWAWFGTAIHAALEVYYRPGFKRAKTQKVLDAFVDSVGEQTGRIYTNPDNEFDAEAFQAEVVDAKELGLEMLRGYIEFYEGDRQWEVIHTEQPFQIDVVDPTDDSKTLVIYAGTWDSLMRHRYTKEFWLWDHKTRASFPSNWSFYNINDQAGSYLWVAPEVLKFLGIFKGGEQISGLIFNALRKAMPDTRPRNHEGKATNKPTKQHFWDALLAAGATPGQPFRKYTAEDLEDACRHRGLLPVFGEVSARQPAEMFHREEIYREENERVAMGQRVQNEAAAMGMMRAGTLKPWKTPTEDCTRCPVYDFCELDEQDPKAARVLARTMYTTTDPYRDHREDMSTKRGVSITKKEN